MTDPVVESSAPQWGLPACCTVQLWQWFFWGMCACDLEVTLHGPCLSAFSPPVLLNLWERPPVTRGPVYAQSHRAPWQWVPCPVQASSLQAVSPRGLQWEDKCQHNYLAQTWWVRGCWGKDTTCKGPDKAQGPSVLNVIKVRLERMVQGQKLG